MKNILRQFFVSFLSSVGKSYGWHTVYQITVLQRNNLSKTEFSPNFFVFTVTFDHHCHKLKLRIVYKISYVIVLIQLLQFKLLIILKIELNRNLFLNVCLGYLFNESLITLNFIKIQLFTLTEGIGDENKNPYATVGTNRYYIHIYLNK